MKAQAPDLSRPWRPQWIDWTSLIWSVPESMTSHPSILHSDWSAQGGHTGENTQLVSVDSSEMVNLEMNNNQLKQNPVEEEEIPQKPKTNKLMASSALNSGLNHQILSGNVSGKGRNSTSPVISPRLADDATVLSNIPCRDSEYPTDPKIDIYRNKGNNLFQTQSHGQGALRRSAGNSTRKNYQVYADLTGPRRRDPDFQPPAYSTCSRSFLREGSLAQGPETEPNNIETGQQSGNKAERTPFHLPENHTNDRGNFMNSVKDNHNLANTNDKNPDTYTSNIDNFNWMRLHQRLRSSLRRQLLHDV